MRRSMTDLQESLQQENHQLSEQLLSNLGVGDIIYQSRAMEDLLQQVDIVAKSDSTVLICGETGTGKEVIARAIHQLSPRRDKPLVKINCAAIPASLLESELFGHDKGRLLVRLIPIVVVLKLPMAVRCFSMKLAICR